MKNAATPQADHITDTTGSRIGLIVLSSSLRDFGSARFLLCRVLGWA